MASEANDNVKKAMDAAREQELAAYIMRDVDLRQQNAQERGVLAYGKKPIPRSKPNNRFLQNTLKSVDFANRKVKEDEMWEKWDARRRSATDSDSQEERPSKRRRGSRRQPSTESSEDSESVSPSETDSEGRQIDIDKRLQAGNARGRGSTGPRADETGPFLFPTDEQDGQTYAERQEYEMLRHARKPTAGPACPDWIRSEAKQEGQPQRSLDAQLLALVAMNQQKKARKEAKRAKRKKSKRKKEEKKKKKRKRRKESSPV